METNPTNHYLNDNGQIVCESHAGHYLASAIQNKPKAKIHDTPLGIWRKLAPAEVMYFNARLTTCCETCRCDA